MTTPTFNPSPLGYRWTGPSAEPVDREGRREPEREPGALAARANVQGAPADTTESASHDGRRAPAGARPAAGTGESGYRARRQGETRGLV